MLKKHGENYFCKINNIEKEKIELDIIEEIQKTSEPKTYIHILQGLPKFEKMETIIEKCTEIGVSEITPVAMQRCVAKLDEKNKMKKIQRWNKIAEVAAKQSKRDVIPIINEVYNLKNIFQILQNYDIVLVAYEEERDNTLKLELKKIKLKDKIKIAIIIGPEGGIDKKEIEFLEKNNCKVVTLGPRILRTETAPIVASANVIYELENEV